MTDRGNASPLDRGARSEITRRFVAYVKTIEPDWTGSPGLAQRRGRGQVREDTRRG